MFEEALLLIRQKGVNLWFPSFYCTGYCGLVG
jgi:hypothetical protein